MARRKTSAARRCTTFIKTAARLVLLASCGASTPSYSHSYVTRLRHRNVITQYIVFAVVAYSRDFRLSPGQLLNSAPAGESLLPGTTDHWPLAGKE